MALSARERRTLAEIEEHLRTEAPRLDALMRQFSVDWVCRLAGRWRAGVAVCLALLALTGGLLTSRFLPGHRAGRPAVVNNGGPGRTPARGPFRGPGGTAFTSLGYR